MIKLQAATKSQIAEMTRDIFGGIELRMDSYTVFLGAYCSAEITCVILLKVLKSTSKYSSSAETIQVKSHVFYL